MSIASLTAGTGSCGRRKPSSAVQLLPTRSLPTRISTPPTSSASPERKAYAYRRTLSIIGFDGTDVADFLGLTTIDQGLDESGRLAAEMLMSRISDRGRPPQEHAFAAQPDRTQHNIMKGPFVWIVDLQLLTVLSIMKVVS